MFVCWDEGLRELEFVCRLKISYWCRWAGVFGRVRRDVLSAHSRGRYGEMQTRSREKETR